MVKNLNAAKMRNRASFGTTVSEPNINGVYVPVFKESFKRYFGNWSRTLNQTYTLVGTDLEDSKVIYVRHDEKIESCSRVKIKDVEYEIVAYNPDADDTSTSFDLITLKKVK